MKIARPIAAGPVIGFVGVALFVASLLIRDKRYEVTQVVLGVTAMCTLAVATIFVGVQKHRPWCGVGLALLSPVYGVGFMVILLVPEKQVRQAESGRRGDFAPAPHTTGHAGPSRHETAQEQGK